MYVFLNHVGGGKKWFIIKEKRPCRHEWGRRGVEKRKTSPYGRYYTSYFGRPGRMAIIESIIKVD